MIFIIIQKHIHVYFIYAYFESDSTWSWDKLQKKKSLWMIPHLLLAGIQWVTQVKWVVDNLVRVKESSHQNTKDYITLQCYLSLRVKIREMNECEKWHKDIPKLCLIF